MVDWYPTLLKLAGASREQKLPLDGRDAWPTISAGRPSPHTEILLNSTPRNGAIRAGDWKLVLNGEVVELFNLAQDPSEKNNQATTNPAKVKELRARYEALARQAAAPKQAPKARDFKTPAVWGETD
jgi:arylsulfatase A-like enzyme